MAGRHRARFRSVQVIKVSEITASQVRRPYIQQLIVTTLLIQSFYTLGFQA